MTPNNRDQQAMIGPAFDEDEIQATPLDDPWVHRSLGMRCATCMYYVKKASMGERRVDDRGPLGRCRRRAPSMSGFPAVFATDWCGDHKIDEQKL